MNNRKYAVFILSFGRADRVYTYETLKKYGYKGDIVIICSDDDKQLAEYKRRFKNVYVFNKKDALKHFDIGDNFDDLRVVVFARNMCFKIAQEFGYDYFVEMDDDYTDIMARYEENGQLKKRYIEANKLFESYFKFLDNSRATCVALAQGGDFIGGLKGGAFKRGYSRKLMNVYFCDVKKPFKFFGRLNEDTTTYSFLGLQGVLFITPFFVMIVQKETQSNAGGLTEIYRERGTFFKTFYSVMYCPSAVKVSLMGVSSVRVHHTVHWNNCVPKIISEELKKQ